MADEKTTKAKASSAESTDATAKPVRSAEEALQESQEKGYQGVDSAEQAGGIDALRSQTRERLEAGGDQTGATEPRTSPGHPSDPTVATSTKVTS